MTDEKKTISAVLIGMVDSGKSTIAGNFLSQLKYIDAKTMKDLEIQANEMGKSSFKYAWVLDNLKSERERGITIDISLQKFETSNYAYTIIDAPGHRDFMKNLITGTSQGDIAVLCVDASPDAFEASVSEYGQLREHILLAHTLGVKQIIVVINKMDCTAPTPYNEARFDECVKETTAYIESVGYTKDDVMFVPCSGWAGENLIQKSDKMPWYEGPCLLEMFDSVRAPIRHIHKPLRIPIQDIYRVGGIGTVPVGRIEAGVIRSKMDVVFAPSDITSEVVSVERHHKIVEEAEAGSNVGFAIRNVSVKELHRGFVASDARNNPATSVKSFVTHCIILNHPGEIADGYCPVVDIHTAHVTCSFKLLEKKDRQTGEVLEKNPKCVRTGDACTVEMFPTKPVSVEPFDDYPALGRFAVRDMNQTIAVGTVISIVREEAVLDEADDW